MLHCRKRYSAICRAKAGIKEFNQLAEYKIYMMQSENIRLNLNRDSFINYSASWIYNLRDAIREYKIKS